MQPIISNSELLALYIPATHQPEQGSQFFCDNNDFIQLASHRYDAGKHFLPHQHKMAPRTADRTQEVLMLLQGSLKADFFDLDQRAVASLILQKGDILILLQGGHGFEVLSDDTYFIEVKNGPYPGAEQDRFRLFQ